MHREFHCFIRALSSTVVATNQKKKTNPATRGKDSAHLSKSRPRSSGNSVRAKKQKDV
jgi:hypothetical protein